MSEYIIRYKFGTRQYWNYSIGIIDGSTHSHTDRNKKSVITMTLVEAQKYVKKIVKLRKKDNGGTVTEIQILNAKTNKIMRNEPEPKLISRFELMEI